MQEDIVIDDLKSLKKNMLREGNLVNSYLLDDGKVYDEFCVILESLEVPKILQGIDCSTFCLPESLVFDNKEKSINDCKGYTRKYIDGVSLDKINGDVEIRKLIDAFTVMEMDIAALALNRLVASNFRTDNLIYKDGLLYNIAGCSCELDNQSLYESYIKKRSLKEMSIDVLGMFTGNGTFKNEKINKMIRDLQLYGILSPSYVIYSILEEIEKEKKENIETLDEYKKSLSLIKRK